MDSYSSWKSSSISLILHTWEIAWFKKKNKPAKGEIFKYDRAWLGLSDKEINEKLESGAPYSIRMLVPGGETSFQDMIHGKITVDNKKIDDQILIRSDGNPTNHFSNTLKAFVETPSWNVRNFSH